MIDLHIYLEKNEIYHRTDNDKRAHRASLGEMDNTRIHPKLELCFTRLVLPLSENGPTSGRGISLRNGGERRVDEL